jgi:hypothetical protein
VYKKIHLGRDDVVKKKEKSVEEKKEEVKEGFNVDSFRDIESQGLTPGDAAPEDTTTDAPSPEDAATPDTTTQDDAETPDTTTASAPDGGEN